jgi:hypothetical protein
MLPDTVLAPTPTEAPELQTNTLCCRTCAAAAAAATPLLLLLLLPAAVDDDGSEPASYTNFLPADQSMDSEHYVLAAPGTKFPSHLVLLLLLLLLQPPALIRQQQLLLCVQCISTG